MKSPSKRGNRCTRDCVPGEDRCDRHLGLMDIRGKNFMHKFYLAKLRPTLLEAVEGAVRDAPITEQLSLLDEVLLVRHAASHSVQQYDEAVASGKPEAQLLAAELLKSSMKEVSEIVKAAATVEETKAKIIDSFTTAVGHLVTQVMQAAAEAFGDDHRVPEFERSLRARLELVEQQRERLGTDLTPEELDKQVTEMDAAIP